MQFVSLVTGVAAISLAMLTAQSQTQPAPSISNARVVGKDVAKYDRVEIHFDVVTIASNSSLPFDAAPPPGLPKRIGVRRGWGQVNPGGMYDLLWWASDTVDQNIEEGRYTHIYTHFLTYQNFMAGIPLNNGHYRDARATTSHPNLRVWGQRDDANGRAHLWIQNTQHTWRSAVNGEAVAVIRGQITLPDMRSGVYRVTWWDPYAIDRPVFLEQTVNHPGGNMVLALPRPLADDVAVKVERMK